MSAGWGRLAGWLAGWLGGRAHGREWAREGDGRGVYCIRNSLGRADIPLQKDQPHLMQVLCLPDSLMGKRSKVSFHSSPGRVFPY